MLEYGVNLGRPVVIRYPRGGEEKEFKEHEKIETGKAEIIRKGKDISIIAIGKMASRAEDIGINLEKEGIDVEVINARFLKPLDKETIKKSITKTKNVITIEDGTIINGLATAIKELIIDEKLEDINIKSYAYPDEFIRHGGVEELEKIYKVDEKSIVKEIEENLQKVTIKA